MAGNKAGKTRNQMVPLHAGHGWDDVLLRRVSYRQLQLSAEYTDGVTGVVDGEGGMSLI